MTKQELLAQIIQEKTWVEPYYNEQLDAEIAVLLRYHPYGPNHWLNRSPEYRWIVTGRGRYYFLRPEETETNEIGLPAPNVTGSLDDLVTIINWALPGHVLEIFRAAINDVTDQSNPKVFNYCCLEHLMTILIAKEQVE